MQIKPRDIDIIKCVNDYRLLKQSHLEHLFFKKKQSTAQVRLRLLYDHFFLNRYFLHVSTGFVTSPVIYSVGEKGVELLRREFDYSNAQLRHSTKHRLKDNFLLHTLGLSEIRLQFSDGALKNNLTVSTWFDEKTHKGNIDRVQVGHDLVPVVPDGYCKLTDPEGYHYHFFIEYDRRKEPAWFIRKKMSGYVAYLQSARCRERYGTNTIRVLTVIEGAESKKRIKTFKDATTAVGGGHSFYFTNLGPILKHDCLTSPIWDVVDTPEKVSLI